MSTPQIPGIRVRSKRGGESWQVTADHVHAVQQLAVMTVGHAALTELEITVTHWRAPAVGWMGRPGIAGIVDFAWASTDTGVCLRIRTRQPVDSALLLSAAIRCLRLVPTGETGPLLTFAPGLPADAAALGGVIHDVLLPGDERDVHVRRCDVLVAPHPDTATGIERAQTIVVRPGEWTRDGEAFAVSVDPTVHRPIGRRSAGAGDIAHAVVSGDELSIVGTDGTLRVRGDVTAANALSLRRTLAVVSEDAIPERWTRQLQACGVVVASTARQLPAVGDHLAWQATSIHDRRHALRLYSPAAAMNSWPTVSIVLATNRPDHLAHAISQLDGLEYPRLEIIIGAHGAAVDPGRVAELARDVPHPVRIIAIDGSYSLGEALQSCSDRAEGTLISKMDDDDVYGPEHVWDLVLARMYSGAQIVGKALDWVFVESADATVFRPTYAAEKYADFVAGGTMLISRADLAAVGGWRPVPKSVDRALLDRVLADGGLVYRTHGLGYIYVRHSAGHTATVKDEHFLTKTVAQHPGLLQHPAFGTGDPA